MSHNDPMRLVVFSVAVILSSGALAQKTPETEALKARIVELENRVTAIERMIGGSSSPALKYSEKWKDRSLWRRLRTGMSMGQVENLLGIPERIRGGDITFWNYSPIASVSFWNGTVHSWTEP